MAIRKAGKRPTLNPVEKRLAKALRDNGLKFSAQYCFHPKRKWRFDFACERAKIAVEVEGRDHLRLRQSKLDRDKFNAALLMGWRVLRYEANAVMTNKRLPLIVDQIKEAYYDSPSDLSHIHVGDD